MLKACAAEWMLRQVAGEERGAGIYGDLVELASTRGGAWFWRAYARTLLGLVWQTLVGRAATAIVIGTSLIGSLVGLIEGRLDSRIYTERTYLAVLESAAGLGLGLLAGIAIAAWVLGLGYVYGDARRRRMHAVLWTLIAALTPNLLGFLLFFALRPTASSFPLREHGTSR